MAGESERGVKIGQAGIVVLPFSEEPPFFGQEGFEPGLDVEARCPLISLKTPRGDL